MRKLLSRGQSWEIHWSSTEERCRAKWWDRIIPRKHSKHKGTERVDLIAVWAWRTVLEADTVGRPNHDYTEFKGNACARCGKVQSFGLTIPGPKEDEPTVVIPYVLVVRRSPVIYEIA